MNSLLTRLRAELKKAADPEKALPMQRYMKSAMPYHGVPTPIARPILKQLFSQLEFHSTEEWRSTVLDIWNNARFREERYAALALCEHRSAADFQTPAALSLYEELIVTGAWWDYVDTLASHGVGNILRRFPKPVSRSMRAWSRADNMWKRRTSIICQLSFKKDTDLDLLYACIEPSLDSKEFFLRKAIGWALRQYAWTDPAEVRRYIVEHESRLSSLSKREALRNIQ